MLAAFCITAVLGVIGFLFANNGKDREYTFTRDEVDAAAWLYGRAPPNSLLIEGARNTIRFEGERALHTELFKLLATNHSPESSASTLKDLLCCLPKVALPTGLGYRNLFRVIILAFQDAQSLDVRSVKKSCVHIAQPDGTIVPFDTYNLFYRDDRRRQLEALRARVDTADIGSARAGAVEVANTRTTGTEEPQA